MRSLASALLLAACIACGAGATRAQDATPAARAALEQGLTLVSMSESAQRELRRDRLRIELRAAQAGRDPARVQAEVNRIMAAALARAPDRLLRLSDALLVDRVAAGLDAESSARGGGGARARERSGHDPV
ncbi:MAG: hypothetical protein ACKOUS_04150, partial [Alphaproteobacteria bacterium]